MRLAVLQVRAIQADLADLRSVRSGAAEVLSWLISPCVLLLRSFLPLVAIKLGALCLICNSAIPLAGLPPFLDCIELFLPLL